MLNNKALQVPYGTRDVLPGEAGARRIIENKLASTFKAWGSDEVVTPTFEYLDTFAAAGQLSDSSFKFFIGDSRYQFYFPGCICIGMEDAPS